MREEKKRGEKRDVKKLFEIGRFRFFVLKLGKVWDWFGFLKVVLGYLCSFVFLWIFFRMVLGFGRFDETDCTL